jgi:hypothetical protein
MNETQDLAILRIREVRYRISEQYGHDPQRLINYYLELQQKFTKQLLPDNTIEEPEADYTVVPVVSFATPLP